MVGLRIVRNGEIGTEDGGSRVRLTEIVATVLLGSSHHLPELPTCARELADRMYAFSWSSTKIGAFFRNLKVFHGLELGQYDDCLTRLSGHPRVS